MNKTEYLKLIDKVISDGKYKDNWGSLYEYGLPDWYLKSKLGIFIHWGVYSVPEYHSEWYPRLMYYNKSIVHSHHVKKYGKNYDYSRFIDDFKAEKFNSTEWVKLFKDMGADFLLPVGEHHDGFKMYDSDLSPFTSVKMGPHRDIIGELKSECEKQDLTFTVSSHYAERWFYFNNARLGADNEIVRGEKPELYGAAYKPDNIHNSVKLNAFTFGKDNVPSVEWLEDWLVNTCELLDRYKPHSLWLDWWVGTKAFKPYMRKMLAYYYNRSIEWGYKVCVQSKGDSVLFGQGIFDCERGQLDGAKHFKWQSETATSYSSWGYTKDSKFKTPEQIACNFIDVISKNGVYVLNFGPKADGSFCAEELDIIAKFGKFINTHKDIIHNAVPYRVYGEGAKHKHGSFKEKIQYTEKEFRFLYDTDKLYVFALKQSKNNVYKIFSLADQHYTANYIYKGARVVGSDSKVTLNPTSKYLEITLDKHIENNNMPICIELEVE